MSTERGCERSRTLIVHKDEAGYGLTLSGDKPTRVQTVKAGGASDRAGVREGDVIIKVNGQQVTDSAHTAVVQLIQAGSYVALTVVHSSRFSNIGPGSGTEAGGQPHDRRDSVRISGDDQTTSCVMLHSVCQANMYYVNNIVFNSHGRLDQQNNNEITR